MIRHRTGIGAAALAAAVFVILSFTSSTATVVDFNGLDAGTIVAGEDPTGATVSNDTYVEFTLSCINNGNGPNSVIIFDSQNPTGGDTDLGTPNVDFGGPGVGWGGSDGRPGENEDDWGNLLIIAENVIDCDGDGLVDDPDDEARGGVFIFEFEQAVIIQRIVLVDIDSDETAEVRLYDISGIVATIPAQALGSNSVQALFGESYIGILRMEVELSSSGAIGEMEYVLDTTPVAQSTWGSIKAGYSR
jgi:hypothetical protein